MLLLVSIRCVQQFSAFTHATFRSCLAGFYKDFYPTTLIEIGVYHIRWSNNTVYFLSKRKVKAVANEETYCCGNIVADANVSSFVRARNICCGRKKSVSE